MEEASQPSEIVVWGGGILDNNRKPEDLKRFNKNKKQKQIILGSIIVIVAIIGGISLYRSFAMYEEKQTFNVLKGTVPDFRKGDYNFIALTVNGEKTSTVPPKATYSKIDVKCDKDATGEWDKERWGLFITSDIVPVFCTVDFTMEKNSEFLFDYTGNEQEFIAPIDGKYQIELWGASGEGNVLGGYTKGEIELTSGTTLYIYVGGKGNPTDGSITGGYNGGGNSTKSANGKSGPTGGGATDVRLINGTWNEFESLKSRIMVAGGGAGGGGSAGGLNGYDGNASPIENCGKGGSQTLGGAQASRHRCASSNSTAGSFGTGGIGGANTTDATTGGGSGGGGGYYGGSGASGICNGNMLAGGGSSYISGHDGCKAITKESASNSITHSSSSEHYSGKVFTETVMIDGNGYNWTTEKGEKIGMPKHDGTEGTMDGNSGNGYARITYLGND